MFVVFLIKNFETRPEGCIRVKFYLSSAFTLRNGALIYTEREYPGLSTKLFPTES